MWVWKSKWETLLNRMLDKLQVIQQVRYGGTCVDAGEPGTCDLFRVLVALQPTKVPIRDCVNHFTGALLQNPPSTPFSLSVVYMQRPASLSYWEVIVKLLGSILACARIGLFYSSQVNNLDTIIDMKVF